MKKKKMGRPTVPKEKQRNEILSVRLNGEEHRKIVTASKKDGKTTSAWARLLLTKAAE